MAQITIQEALNKIANAVSSLNINVNDKAKWETDITNLKTNLSTLTSSLNTKATSSSVSKLNTNLSSLSTSLTNLRNKVNNLHHHDVHFFKSLTDPELTKIDVSTFQPGEVIYVGIKEPYEAYIWAKNGSNNYGWKHTGKANEINIKDYYKKIEIDALLKTINDNLEIIKNTANTAKEKADNVENKINPVKEQAEKNRISILDIKTSHKGSDAEKLITKGEYRWFPKTMTPDPDIWEKVSLTEGYTLIEGGGSYNYSNGSVISHKHKRGAIAIVGRDSKTEIGSPFGVNPFPAGDKTLYTTSIGGNANLAAGIFAHLYKAKRDVYSSMLSQSQVKDIQKISQLEQKVLTNDQTTLLKWLKYNKENINVWTSKTDDSFVLGSLSFSTDPDNGGISIHDKQGNTVAQLNQNTYNMFLNSLETLTKHNEILSKQVEYVDQDGNISTSDFKNVPNGNLWEKSRIQKELNSLYMAEEEISGIPYIQLDKIGNRGVDQSKLPFIKVYVDKQVYDDEWYTIDKNVPFMFATYEEAIAMVTFYHGQSYIYYDTNTKKFYDKPVKEPTVKEVKVIKIVQDTIKINKQPPFIKKMKVKKVQAIQGGK